MAKGFKHGGGSGSGTGGTLTISAPVGSTITITKDGKSYFKLVDAEGIALFKGLDGGTWSIYSTDGNNNAEKSIPIVIDYSESISYQYVVFDGTNTVDYVGGWSSDVSSGELSVAAGGAQGWISGKNLCSNVAIDISQYSTMHIVVSGYNDGGTFGIGTTNANGSYDKSVAIASATEYTIDVSDIDGEYYVKLASSGKQNNTNYYESIGFSVSKVWLE